MLRCAVCDAPAKAMTKKVELRTDESFRTQTNPEYHSGQTPFCDLPIDMVKKFQIDYMHQVCLGVQKRLLLSWIRGKKEVRMSAGHAKEIGERLEFENICAKSVCKKTSKP